MYTYSYFTLFLDKWQSTFSILFSIPCFFPLKIHSCNRSVVVYRYSPIFFFFTVAQNSSCKCAVNYSVSTLLMNIWDTSGLCHYKQYYSEQPCINIFLCSFQYIFGIRCLEVMVDEYIYKLPKSYSILHSCFPSTSPAEYLMKSFGFCQLDK